MTNLLLVFICLVLGLLFQHSKKFPESSAAVLNNFVIYVALPALIFKEIPVLKLDQEALLPVIMAWVVMAFCALVVFSCARLMSWSQSVTGAMLLVCVLGNTSFVGIPLLEAHLGRDSIPYGILYDQLGTFLALNTFGIAVVSFYSSEGKTNATQVLYNILSFPPFIALVIAFALRGVSLPLWFGELASRLAATLVPVVVVAVGMQWKLRPEKSHLKIISFAMLLILVLKPAFAFLILKFLEIKSFVAYVVVLEAAMPAMISAGALAVSANLAPRLASTIIGYSLLFSLVSVWLWRITLIYL